MTNLWDGAGRLLHSHSTPSSDYLDAGLFYRHNPLYKFWFSRSLWIWWVRDGIRASGIVRTFTGSTSIQLFFLNKHSLGYCKPLVKFQFSENLDFDHFFLVFLLLSWKNRFSEASTPPFCSMVFINICDFFSKFSLSTPGCVGIQELQSLPPLFLVIWQWFLLILSSLALWYRKFLQVIIQGEYGVNFLYFLFPQGYSPLIIDSLLASQCFRQ